MKSESTHVNGNGDVVAVYNDGDNGIYVHDEKSLSDWGDTKEDAYLKTSGEGVFKFGETSTWDEYVDPLTGKPEGNVVDNEKAASGNSENSAPSPALTVAGLASTSFSTAASISSWMKYDKNSHYFGKNHKLYPIEHHPNQYTGSRSAAAKTASLISRIGRGFGAINYGVIYADYTANRMSGTQAVTEGTINAVNHNYIINQSFTYDHTGRPLKIYHQIGDNGTNVLLSGNVYNELGQVKQKKLHEKATVNTFLQTVDYTYNIRGWLETINDFATAADLFALKLTYGEGDPALDPNYANGANANYNGNITMMEWKVKGNTYRHIYGLRYDQYDRLTTATYADRSTTLDVNNKYNTAYTYDEIGNILTQTRRGLLSGTTFGLIDNLTYNYTGSRLTSVTETSGSTKGVRASSSYTYDANGNMTYDNDKQMTVSYNYLNLPRSFIFASENELTITYTASGSKLTKTAGSAVKHYVGGIEYNGSQLEAIYHPEGRSMPNGSGGWTYEYVIKDHLGTGRVWFAPNAAGTATATRQEVHYDPFGFELEGINGAMAPASPANTYHYNGKELNPEFGIGWLDYGARWFEAALGRWWSVDPLTSVFMNQSPYGYAAENPINQIDVLGLYFKDVIKDNVLNNDEEGKFLDTDNFIPTIADDIYIDPKGNVVVIIPNNEPDRYFNVVSDGNGHWTVTGEMSSLPYNYGLPFLHSIRYENFDNFLDVNDPIYGITAEFYINKYNENIKYFSTWKNGGSSQLKTLRPMKVLGQLENMETAYKSAKLLKFGARALTVVGFAASGAEIIDGAIRGDQMMVLKGSMGVMVGILAATTGPVGIVAGAAYFLIIEPMIFDEKDQEVSK